MYAHVASSLFLFRVMSLSNKVVSWCVDFSARMFGKFEGVLQMHRFYSVDTVEYLT